jgi:hypothetical protein
MALIDLTSVSLLQSGINLYNDTSLFREIDDSSDAPTHQAIEGSGREDAEHVALFKHIIGIQKYITSGLWTHNHSLVNLSDVNTSGISNSDTLVWNQTENWFEPAANETTDTKVLASDTDTTAGYLNTKCDNVGIQIYANKLQLVNSGVSFSKLQNIGDDVILGSSISGGSVQQLTLTSTNGMTTVISGSSVTINTPQDLRTSATPEFNALTLSNAINGLFLNYLNSVSGVSILAAESGKGFSNREATAEVEHTLPNPSQGLVFIFAVRDTDGIKVRAPSGKYIQIGASCSTAGGFCLSTAVGSSLILLGIDDTYFQAISSVGTWSVDS